MTRHRTTFRSLILAGFALVGAGFAFGQDNAPLKPVWSIEGARLFGGDLGLTYGPWKAVGGLGYESWDFGRDPTTGAPLGTDSPYTSSWVPNAEGTITYAWKQSVGTFWVGGTAMAFGTKWSSPANGIFPDYGSGLFGAVIAGFTRDRTTANAHRVKSGHKIEVSGEYGPSVFSLRKTSYEKLRLASSFFFPLWDFDTVVQTFSGDLAFRLNEQYTDGSQVPVPLLEPTEVRGYYRTFDTKLQSVGTAELRVGGPSLWGTADLIPLVFGFVDVGGWQGYADAPSSYDQTAGWLASVGGGIGLEVLGLATPTLTVAKSLVDPEPTLWWKLNLNLRF